MLCFFIIAPPKEWSNLDSLACVRLKNSKFAGNDFMTNWPSVFLFSSSRMKALEGTYPGTAWGRREPTGRSKFQSLETQYRILNLCMVLMSVIQNTTHQDVPVELRKKTGVSFQEQFETPLRSAVLLHNCRAFSTASVTSKKLIWNCSWHKKR